MRRTKLLGICMMAAGFAGVVISGLIQAGIILEGIILGISFLVFFSGLDTVRSKPPANRDNII